MRYTNVLIIIIIIINDTRDSIAAVTQPQIALFSLYQRRVQLRRRPEGVVFIVSRLLAAACRRMQALAGDYGSSLP